MAQPGGGSPRSFGKWVVLNEEEAQKEKSLLGSPFSRGLIQGVTLLSCHLMMPWRQRTHTTERVLNGPAKKNLDGREMQRRERNQSSALQRETSRLLENTLPICTPSACSRYRFLVIHVS